MSDQTDIQYFKEYRNKLGFSSKDQTKNFLSGKDISPEIDYIYIEKFNNRLCNIIEKINNIIIPTLKNTNMETFYNDKIFNVYSQIKKNNIIPLLNNQGRRPEQVYFSWMRGFVISHYFQKSLAYIFNTTEDNISIIGADDFSKKENFKRSPTADLLIITNNTTLRIEMQSGFQDINDIKQHKVLEAKNIYNQSSEKTLVIHFDIFNGQVAFVPVYNIENTSLHWITRQQMEGQTVFNISQNNFIWKLTEQYPSLKEIEKILCL